MHEGETPECRKRHPCHRYTKTPSPWHPNGQPPPCSLRCLVALPSAAAAGAQWTRLDTLRSKKTPQGPSPHCGEVWDCILLFLCTLGDSGVCLCSGGAVCAVSGCSNLVLRTKERACLVVYTLLLLLFAGTIFCEFLRFGENRKIKYPQNFLPTYQALWCMHNHKLRDVFYFGTCITILFWSFMTFFLPSRAITSSRKYVWWYRCSWELHENFVLSR